MECRLQSVPQLSVYSVDVKTHKGLKKKTHMAKTKHMNAQTNKAQTDTSAAANVVVLVLYKDIFCRLFGISGAKLSRH